ncbi:hypothetical protein WR25_10093 [Diploscapter pachys]|uniref:CX domain-containing protein n=1 Tax=Diploscapter pachys TaxID=2018661 RepID=A0A2A2LFE6_9BILA|nr:hypothetical protein WR25_10093 [Diploscapter pachys]
MDTSLKVLKKILEKYSVESIYSDEDGAVWMNKLIPNNQTIIIDGVRYYLNDNYLEPRHRFHFSYDELVAFPILIPNWRADHPDFTKILSSISRDCGRLDTCGTVCCSPLTVDVQREFFDQARLLNLPLGQRVDAFGRVYSFDKDLVEGNGTLCEYELTYYDRLYQQAERIFFRCNEPSSCCGLTCKMPFDDTIVNNKNLAVAMASIYDGELEDSRGELNADDVKLLFLIGSVIMLMIFSAITIYSKRKMNEQVDLEKVCQKRRQTRTSEGFIEFNNPNRNTSLDTKTSLLEG